MFNSKIKIATLTLICLLSLQGFAQPQKTVMALIKGGSYIPLYGADSTWVNVDDFYMDPFPVTNEEFLDFVQKNPEWQKSEIIELFADERYLFNWKNDDSLGEHMNKRSPVTNVSWFAAKKFCECQGKRLPSLDEWEYAAMADEETPDARVKESYNQNILSWYETPKTFENNIGSTFKNYWGVYDLHGLVWEWTMDFNSVLLSSESRKDSGDPNLFCGSASVGATDLMNYAAFMRYAFRGSIKARYSIQNLGFRCAQDLKI